MKPDPARPLLVWLAISFLLTVLAFTGSRIVTEGQLRGIDGEARTLRGTVPARSRLAEVQAGLTATEAELDRITDDHEVPEDVRSLGAAVLRLRVARERAWAAYLALPVFPEERPLIDAIQSSMEELTRSMDLALGRASSGDLRGAAAEARAHTRRSLHRTREGVRALAVVDDRLAVDAADRIVVHAARSKGWGIALDVMSALFALSAAWFVIGLARRQWTQMGERLDDLERFAGRVAHDIRSPLNTVSLVLELAKGRAELDPKTRANIDMGMRTLQRVGGLVDGLLVFALAGKPPVADAKADVRAVLDDVVGAMRPFAEEKAIALRYEPPEGPSLIACSPGVLVSLISNLLSNAVKYMGDAPLREVAVHVLPAGGRLRVEVRDTGPGIPPELRSKLFHPYVRGADSKTTGFGLGLATVRRLAEVHGGAAGVRPNPGGGSIFWFEIPIAEETSRAPSPPGRPALVRPSASSAT